MSVGPEVIPASMETWDSLASFLQKHEPECFCGWPRCQPREFIPGDPRNKQIMRVVIESGYCPGLLAFLEGEAVGWCAISPLSEYPQYEVSETDGWGLACVSVAEQAQGRGVGRALVSAALVHAKAHGAACVYGPPSWWWAGTEQLRDRMVAMLLAEGFEEVGDAARIPVLRKQLR